VLARCNHYKLTFRHCTQ